MSSCQHPEFLPDCTVYDGDLSRPLDPEKYRFCPSMSTCPKWSQSPQVHTVAEQKQKNAPTLSFEQFVAQEELARPLLDKYYETHENFGNLPGGEGKWLPNLPPEHQKFVSDVINVLAGAGLLTEQQFKLFVDTHQKKMKQIRQKVDAEMKEKERRFWGFKTESQIRDVFMRKNLKKVIK